MHSSEKYMLKKFIYLNNKKIENKISPRRLRRIGRKKERKYCIEIVYQNRPPPKKNQYFSGNVTTDIKKKRFS